MPRMNFKRDVAKQIVSYFEENSIRHDQQRFADPEYLLERFFRVLSKMIAPRPRVVHYSAEMQAKLGSLGERYRQPLIEIEKRFAAGGDLTEFLSRLTETADVPDAMLNDFGIHHLHLGMKRSPSAKRVERSDLLLLVCVRPDDAYFVDVRPHPQQSDPDDVGWSDQEYLWIIDRNWSHLLDPYELPGVNGDTITDIERKALRCKNVNVVIQLGDRAIAPPGGGTTASGANLTHRIAADRLLDLIRKTQEAIEANWSQLRRDLEQAGIQVNDDTELRLVRIDPDDLTPELRSIVTSDLGRSGWIVRETASGRHVDWNFVSADTDSVR